MGRAVVLTISAEDTYQLKEKKTWLDVDTR